MAESVYFFNEEAIDLNVIRVMGVSVKKNDNPIGYFGTGLKYALAVLLRTGHEVSLFVEGVEYPFSTGVVPIRGEPHDFVFMGEERLPFTTDYGKNWQVWQAYRELMSNAKDEGGGATLSEFVGEGMGTVIQVTGAEIVKAHQERRHIFLEGVPDAVADRVEIYNRPSEVIYYRGIRVGQLHKPAALTYNLLVGVSLTEDRTVSSEFDVKCVVQADLPELTDESIIRTVLYAEHDSWERELDFSSPIVPSAAWWRVLDEVAVDAKVNPTARRGWEKKNAKKAETKASELTATQENAVQQAILLARQMGASALDRSEFVVVPTLGANTWGVTNMRTKEIFISETALDMGVDHLAATLFEEWAHKTHGLNDCSRGMQDYLLQRLVQKTRERDALIEQPSFYLEEF